MPQVAADADKVRQVLVNLVENAIKYSPDGGRVEVGIEERDGFLRFHVRDEGLGIAPEDQEQIFEKFYRADPQMTRGVGGTGLGLYICRELIDRMGGRIWAEPNGSKGSMFVFELPTAEVMAHGQRGGPRLQLGNDIRGRPGFDVVGSPAELQAEVPGRPPKTTGTQRKCEEHKRTRSRCLTRSEARRSELGPWLG